MPHFRWISIAVLGLLAAPVLILSIETVHVQQSAHCVMHGMDQPFDRVLVDGETWTLLYADPATGSCAGNGNYITSVKVSQTPLGQISFTQHNISHFTIDNSRWIDIISPSIGLLGGFLKPLLYGYGALALVAFYALATNRRWRRLR